MNTKKLTYNALLTALAAALTFFPRFPTPLGYIHFGDSIIWLAAMLSGAYPAAIVGALGHSIADLLSGNAVYIIPTIIIKGVMGFVVGKIIYSKNDIKHFAAAGIAALVIVTLGYFLWELFIFGIAAAVPSMLSSVLQCIMNVAVFWVITRIIGKIK